MSTCGEKKNKKTKQSVDLFVVNKISCFQMVMLVKENPLLAEAEALDKCRRVMELICEKCIKQQDMNEVLAMKMHFISCVLGKCASFLKDREDKLDGLIKRSGHMCDVGESIYALYSILPLLDMHTFMLI